MKRIFKPVLLCFTAILLLVALTACSTSLSLTFNVDTGDSIKVELDTTGGYSLKANGATFEVYEGDTLLTTGIFLTREMLEPYLAVSEDTQEITILEKKDNGIFYHAGNEWNYVFQVEGSSTGVALVNLISQESAQTCYSLLTITSE